MQVAIELRKPVKKLHTTINYISTVDGRTDLHGKRTQIPIELIKDPYYRMYLRNVPDKYQQQLIDRLTEHRAVFMPYLGISEMLANFQFVGVYPVEDVVSTEPVFVNSIVPANVIEPMMLHNNKLGKERIPLLMNEDKQTLLYMDVAFDMNAKPIPVKNSTYSVVNGTNIKFLTKEDTVTFQRLTVA